MLSSSSNVSAYIGLMFEGETMIEDAANKRNTIEMFIIIIIIFL